MNGQARSDIQYRPSVFQSAAPPVFQSVASSVFPPVTRSEQGPVQASLFASEGSCYAELDGASTNLPPTQLTQRQVRSVGGGEQVGGAGNEQSRQVSYHLKAAHRLARTMRGPRRRSPEQVKTGRAICRHLLAVLNEQDSRG